MSYIDVVASGGTLTERQKQRQQRDHWYCTSHSAPGLRFIEAPMNIEAEVKALVKGHALHHVRDLMNGVTSHYARNASRNALRDGKIDKTTCQKDDKKI